MRVYRIHEFRGADSLRREELPDPKRGPGQALVRIHASSLNYRDLMVVKGHYNPKCRCRWSHSRTPPARWRRLVRASRA